MIGDQHYREAEQLLNYARSETACLDRSITDEQVSQMIAEAQVHATLALAAAKATGLNLAGYGGERSAP
jgi:hypothetical protein